MIKNILLIWLSSFIIIAMCQNLPKIPCPDFFKYYYADENFYGYLSIPGIKLGENLRLKVHMSLRASLPNVSC